MKKRGEGVLTPHLLGLILLVLALFLLLMVVAKFTGVLELFADKSQCQWSFFLSSQTKFFGKQTVPPECRMTPITVTKEMLDENLWNINRRFDEITDPELGDKYEESAPNIRQMGKPDGKKRSLTPKEKYELALYDIVAREMKVCWEKVLHGKFPLFDKWHNLIDFTLFGFLRTEAEANPHVLEGDQFKPKSAFAKGVSTFVKAYGPPTCCVICSRIKFDKDVLEIFGLDKEEDEDKKEPAKPGEIATLADPEMKLLTDWLKSNPVPADVKKRSYYEYTLGDNPTGLFEPKYTFKIDEPVAIVYTRINIHKGWEWTQNIVSWAGIWGGKPDKDINTLVVLPYREVGERCHYAVG